MVMVGMMMMSSGDVHGDGGGDNADGVPGVLLGTCWDGDRGW